MNKLKEILTSWNIAFDPNNKQAALASKRIAICNNCEFKATNLGINRCTVCGCALKGKVFSPKQGACPKGKWDEVDNEENKTKSMDIVTPNLQNEFEIEVKNPEFIKPVEIDLSVDEPKKDNTIFVQIASYRDPQLLPTLDDLFSKAKYPDNLTVCVAWQHNIDDSWDNLDKYKNDPRVIIIDIPYKNSKGACWARNAIQGRYTDQTYTLQLDSHHRFIENWDEELIGMYQQLKDDGVDKPLLTGYISSFNPEKDPEGRVTQPWWMTFDRFTPEGIIFFLPSTIPGYENLTKPIPSRFFSAHFTFTSGQFCLEVPHDPEFYFHGEEITLAVRAYTHGYDLFHPHKVVAWHEYTRKGRTKHWDDSSTWSSLNTRTHTKTRKLLNVDGEGDKFIQDSPFGLGKVRTISDYEKYAGIRFSTRGVQEHTTLNKFAPNPEVEDYENSFHVKFKHCIDIHINSLPETDYEFLVVAFHDENGEDIFRKDCPKEELKGLIQESKNNDGWINLWREYNGKKPAKWLVWPYSTSKQWCDRIEGTL
jgi:hypothetical protein